MTAETDRAGRGLDGWARLALWGVPALVLGGHALAVRLGVDGVDWGSEDFLFAGLLLGVAAVIGELTLRLAKTWRTRMIVGAVVGAVVLTVWAEAAVGIFH
jgi:hypothetical protein